MKADRSPCQQLVLDAIARRHSQVGEIMSATGLEEDTVRTCITRLKDAGLVARDAYARDDHNRTRYGLVRTRCLLAEYWRGLRA